MSAHTPGPWKIGLHDGTRQALWSKDGIRIAEAFSVPSDRKDQIEANARLIAAAPDLLEMLEAIVDPESGCRLTALALTNARTIIAKARGSK